MHDEKEAVGQSGEAREGAENTGTAQADAGDLIQALEERLGADGIQQLVSQCLRSSDRARAIQVINAAVGNVRLPASTDRGRMGRLIMEGLGKRREAVLDAIQTLSRDPFEWQAQPAVQERLDQAVDALNKAREDKAGAGGKQLKAAAADVVKVLREVLGEEEARRLVLLNAFPDVVDHMLAALEA